MTLGVKSAALIAVLAFASCGSDGLRADDVSTEVEICRANGDLAFTSVRLTPTRDGTAIVKVTFSRPNGDSLGFAHSSLIGLRSGITVGLQLRIPLTTSDSGRGNCGVEWESVTAPTPYGAV